MTDDFKVGDTVYIIENVCIQNFDDDYYEIPIPVSIFKSTVKECEDWNDLTLRVKLADDNFYFSNWKGERAIFHTRQQALEALKERRKRFLKDYPNDWKRIIKELNKLLEERTSI